MVEILAKAEYLGRMQVFSAYLVQSLREVVDDFRYILPNIFIDHFSELSQYVSPNNLRSPLRKLIEKTDFLQRLRDKPHVVELDELYDSTLFFHGRVNLSTEKQKLMEEIRAIYSKGKLAMPKR